MATDLATGFDTCGAADGGGPIPGIDDGTHIFIADLCDRKTYVWGENGGTTSNALLSVTNGLNHGLAISGGVYYGTDSDGAGTGTAHGSVWTFDPNTLALGTLIATISTPPFIRGIWARPGTNELWVSSGQGIWRIQDPGLASQSVTQFMPASYANDSIDGMGFSPDGSTLYVADVSNAHVVGFSIATGTVVLDINFCCQGPDGIAVAPANDIVGGTDISGNVFVNFNNGTVQRIDVNNSNAVTTVASGGSRGDFVFVDSQGFVDVSQSDRYVRLSPAVFYNPPENTSPPVISGTATVGSTLTCSQGSWSGSPTAFSYQWNRAGMPISGAIDSMYTLVSDDDGQAITCTVTATNTSGQSASATSDPVTPTSPTTTSSTSTTSTTIPACGDAGMPCCAGNTCVAGAICVGGSCVACGGAGEPCCSGDACGTGAVCVDGTCQPCGAASQVCCAGSACGSADLICSAGSCVPCGGAGEPCCAGDTCAAGAVCVAGSCVACGGAGEPCCAGSACAAGAVCVGGTCLISTTTTTSTSPTTTTTLCATACANPRLGAAEECTVLELDGAKVDLSGHSLVDGNMCLGPAGQLMMSGRASVTGRLLFTPPLHFKRSGAATIVGGQVSADLSQQVNDAEAAAATAAALPCTQTIAALKKTQTIAGTGGLNVICLQDIALSGSKVVTLQGGPADEFVVNVTGRFSLSGSSHIQLAGGVEASAVLYNATASGTGRARRRAKVTLSGSTRVEGTVLAPNRKVSITPGTVIGGVIAGQRIVVSGGGSVRCKCPAP